MGSRNQGKGKPFQNVQPPSAAEKDLTLTYLVAQRISALFEGTSIAAIMNVGQTLIAESVGAIQKLANKSLDQLEQTGENLRSFVQELNWQLVRVEQIATRLEQATKPKLGETWTDTDGNSFIVVKDVTNQTGRSDEGDHSRPRTSQSS